MSHMVTIEGVEITDISCLKKACEELGLKFQEKQTAKYYGGVHKCDYAIAVPGSAYEIAVVKNKNGNGYQLQADFWGTHGRKLEQAVGQLKPMYVQKVVEKNIRKYRGKVLRKQKKGDKLVLHVKI